MSLDGGGAGGSEGGGGSGAGLGRELAGCGVYGGVVGQFHL